MAIVFQVVLHSCAIQASHSFNQKKVQSWTKSFKGLKKSSHSIKFSPRSMSPKLNPLNPLKPTTQQRLTHLLRQHVPAVVGAPVESSLLMCLGVTLEDLYPHSNCYNQATTRSHQGHRIHSEYSYRRVAPYVQRFKKNTKHKHSMLPQIQFHVLIYLHQIQSSHCHWWNMMFSSQSNITLLDNTGKVQRERMRPKGAKQKVLGWGRAACWSVDLANLFWFHPISLF